MNRGTVLPSEGNNHETTIIFLPFLFLEELSREGLQWTVNHVLSFHRTVHCIEDKADVLKKRFQRHEEGPRIKNRFY